MFIGSGTVNTFLINIIEPFQFENQVFILYRLFLDFEIIFMSNINYIFQNVPLWPNHGDAFHYDKFNISNSSESSSFPLDITLEHKVCLNVNCLLYIYLSISGI